jgi:hypothetical protein
MGWCTGIGMRGGVKDPAVACCMVIDVGKGVPSFE